MATSCLQSAPCQLQQNERRLRRYDSCRELRQRRRTHSADITAGRGRRLRNPELMLQHQRQELPNQSVKLKVSCQLSSVLAWGRFGLYVYLACLHFVLVHVFCKSSPGNCLQSFCCKSSTSYSSFTAVIIMKKNKHSTR